MSDMTDERAAEVLAAMRQDGGTVDDADWIAAIDHAVSRLRSQPPAEAQRCPCGQPTCVEPWEPGCGLGNSDEQVAVDAQAVGEAEVMPGTNGGFTAAVFKSVDVPAGTKLYTSPPSAPVGVDAIRIADDLETWVNDPFVTLTPMRKMDVEDFVRRIRALAQQPAPSASVGVEAGWYRYNKPAPRWEDTKFGKWLDPAVYGPPREQHGYSLEVAALSQQPAADAGNPTSPPSAPVDEVRAAIQRDIDDHGVAEIRQAELDALTAPSAPVGVEWLCRVYADAYHAGHHATVEGNYVDVLPVDRDTYWREKVEEDYPEALAQQPASDGGFTAADMMDARQEGRKEAQQPAAVDAEIERLRAEREVIGAEAVKYAGKSGRLEAKVERLTETLRLARDLVEDWAGYASEYFQKKHNLVGDLALLDAVLRDHDQEGKDG